ncbi:HigA family addiction module antitoxin [Burkholderia humptydooensis]|uniref:HigA family addiction module antitoxin n=1 Tax=Burkholderia humptydooensis TaxID=430531 RepID=UPI0009E4372C
MMRTVNPPHPGETLREDLLPELGLTVTEAAQQLGVTRTALSRVLNGHAAISPREAGIDAQIPNRSRLQKGNRVSVRRAARHGCARCLCCRSVRAARPASAGARP